MYGGIELREVIEGQDWSKLKSEPLNGINSFFKQYSNWENGANDSSPINLGIFGVGDDLYSTQFVGVMPMINNDTLKPEFGETEDSVGRELLTIKINSRFHISPAVMLKEVLDGDDYYENPDMLQCREYSISELREWKSDSKILCGVVKNIGKVTLEQSGDNERGVSGMDSFLSSEYPIFEVIRFVSEAKEVCKRNLKQQSMYKEENLVGKVKGRILVNKQIKYNISRGQYQKTYCGYNALSENIKENIIIKYALYLCSKLSIADSLREDILFCNRVLGNVPLKKCRAGDFVGLKKNGAFRQYSHAIDAAKAIINRYYISYDNSEAEETKGEGKIRVSDYSVAPYFIDMNLLFEYYCRALFRKAINELNKQDEFKYVLTLEPVSKSMKQLFYDNSSLGDYYMSKYIPDILVKYKRRREEDFKALAVIDAKYSDVKDQKKSQRQRTHQILFYMNVLNCKNGGLISPYKGGKKVDGVLKGQILYDGELKTKTAPELCYIPLEESVDDQSDKYVEKIKEYLKEVSENEGKRQHDLNMERQQEDDIKNLVGEIKKHVSEGNIEFRGKDLKKAVSDFYNKYK